MRTTARSCGLYFGALKLCAQTVSTVNDRGYSLLRESEDWSFLADSANRNDFWDPVKYIPLGTSGSYVSFGGEIREAFEQVGNDNWGKQNYTNTFFLQRYMLHSDWHLGKWFRVFVQLKSGLEDFRAGGARPIDEKKLDFEAAFLEIGKARRNNWPSFAREAGAELWVGTLSFGPRGSQCPSEFDGASFEARPELGTSTSGLSGQISTSRFFRQRARPQDGILGDLCDTPFRPRGRSMPTIWARTGKTAIFERGTADGKPAQLGASALEADCEEGERPRLRL